jgi:hypothetical protein
MMFFRQGILPALLLAAALPLFLHGAEDPPPTVAIVASPEGANLEALLTAELSKRPEVRLLEREALARIGDERAVQKMAGEDAASLGKLLGAEGLLVLDKDPKGLRCRFTAVGLGYALFDGQFDKDSDPASLAQILAGRIVSFAPKLRLDPGQTVALSVLNLRADIATKESAELERQLTLLLERRLASSPGFIVLERRHAWPLGLERSLSPDIPDLRKGAWVVDGTLSLSQGDTVAVVQLRLRKPGAGPLEIEVKGKKADPPGLVEEIIQAVRKATGQSVATEAWDAREEAREYLLEGLWAWHGKAIDAGVESLDSAELLGEKSADLYALRIDLLRRRAESLLASAKREPASAAADAMVDDTQRALADAAHYEKEKLEAQIDLLTFNRHPIVRTRQIKENLTNFASELIEWLNARQSPRADELRLALRAITGYDPLRGKLGLADFSDPLNVLIDARDQWDITLDEQLAYYGLLGTRPHQYIPPGLLKGEGDGFCRRFLKTPEEQKQAFRQYMRDLDADPNGKLTYALIEACSEDADRADAGCAAFWREMWKRRESLVNQRVQVQEWTSARPIAETRQRKFAKQMIPLLRYYLTHVDNFRYWENSLETMWQPGQWTEEDAAGIWADYLGYKRRVLDDRRARGNWPPNLQNFEKAFEERFPLLKKTAAADKTNPDFLAVSHLWHPWQMEGVPDAPMYNMSSAASGETLWLLCWFRGVEKDRGKLFRLNLSTFAAEEIPLPEPVHYSEMSLGPEALYLEYQKNEPSGQKRGIARLDLATGRWETRTPDVPWRRCFVAGDTVYLGLEGGLGRYDWKDGVFTLLASSRRRPAQNQFDDCDTYRVEGVYAGAGNRAFVVTGRGAFYIREDPGEWPQVYKPTFGMRGVAADGATLNYAGRGAAVLIDPRRDTPEYLMSPRPRPNPRQAAGILPPPWAAQTRWDPVPGVDLNGSVAADRQRLFLLADPGGQQTPREIVRYEGERSPQRILFRFDWDAKLAARLDKYESASSSIRQRADQQTITDFFLANDTLCLISHDAGAWFIPASGLDAWIKQHPALANQLAATEAVQTVSIPPPENDAESRVIGDMIDPAKAEDSFR